MVHHPELGIEAELFGFGGQETGRHDNQDPRNDAPSDAEGHREMAGRQGPDERYDAPGSDVVQEKVVGGREGPSCQLYPGHKYLNAVFELAPNSGDDGEDCSSRLIPGTHLRPAERVDLVSYSPNAGPYLHR